MILGKTAQAEANISLNDPIEIWKEERTGMNTRNEAVFSPKMVARTWARVVPDRGSEFQESYKVFQSQSYKIIMRYRQDIDATMWIRFEGRELQINAIQDLQSRRMYLELVCTERVMPRGN